MDHEDEEEDLESHVVPGSNGGNRSEREGTPGPEPAKESTEQSATDVSASEFTPPSATAEKSETPIKQAADEPMKDTTD